MDISKYTDYFHDGDVNAISHIGNNISFHLESSVIEDVSQIEDVEYLSDSSTFKGTLYLHNIRNFTLNEKKYENVFHVQYDDGEILDLEIIGNAIFLLIEWMDFPPKIRKTDVSAIKIEAEKIEWIPDRESAQ